MPCLIWLLLTLFRNKKHLQVPFFHHRRRHHHHHVDSVMYMLLISDFASCICGHEGICTEINNLFGLFASGKCLEDLVKLRGSKVIRAQNALVISSYHISHKVCYDFLFAII